MSNNYSFIGNYISKNGLYKTLKFIDRFSSTLFNTLKENYHLDTIEVPYALNYSKNNDKRLINFDNRSTNKVYQIINNLNNYTVKIFDELKSHQTFNGLIYQYTSINRDGLVDNVHSISENLICIRKRITSLDKLEPNKLIYDVCNEIMTLVNNIYEQIKSELEIDSEFDFYQIKQISLSSFFSRLHTLKVDDYLLQKLSNQKLVLVNNINGINSKFLSYVDPLYNDLKLSSELLYWYKDLNEIVPLISINILSTYTNSIDQLKKRNINIENYSNELEIIKRSPDQIVIQINLSRFLMILLNKMHIGEVVSGAWDDELYDEAKKKGIHIL